MKIIACPYCGNYVNDSTLVCPHCNTLLRSPTAKDKKPIGTFILAFTLPPVGLITFIVSLVKKNKRKAKYALCGTLLSVILYVIANGLITYYYAQFLQNMLKEYNIVLPKLH